MGLTDFFRAWFESHGGTVVDSESYQANDPNFRSQLTGMRGKSPDAIFIPGYYGDVAMIARQARDLGIKTPLFGGDGWESSKLFELGGPAVVGSYYSTHVAPEDPRPEYQGFVRNFTQRFGHRPDALATLGYDAMMVLAGAMKRAKSLDGSELRDAIAATQGFKGASGTINIDKDRNAAKSAVVVQVVDQNGLKARFVETVNP